ncbi:kelch-like 35 [Plakobranchus ocellatus]|uniref:Kelch-like 35 n=1 Tax=Plakobranchus ocellatus TaxID=259542 RepID=A0AAV4BHA5_9GAST|nr:kelch-like 35 [Plakobranchus ocellatus]
MDNTGHFIDDGFATDMVKSLATYKNDHSFSDVTVVAGATEFPCHRMVLAAKSEFFRSALIKGDKIEDKLNEGKVELEKIDGDTFSNILNYIYCGEIVFTEDNLWDIWDAARRLKIYFVTEKSKEFFRKTLSLDNCLDYFCQVKHLDEKCHQLALNFIQDNFVNLLHLEKFNSLKLGELKCLISGERLKLPHEDDLIEIVLRWTENDLSNSPSRSQHLVDLIKCTRYFLMSKSFLLERLWCSPLIRSDEKCVALMERISRYLSHSFLHQDWCPPAAVHREGSKMVNVLAIVSMYANSQLRLNILSVHSKRQKLCFTNWPSVPNLTQTVYQGEKFYFCDVYGNTMLYSLEADMFKVLGTHDILKWPLCTVGDRLYNCQNGGNGMATVSEIFVRSLHSPQAGASSCQQIGSFELNKQFTRFLNITSIENTLAIFCICQDKVTIIFFDLIRRTSVVVPTEFNLPSTNRVTTVRTDREVFVLEESGSFWRICRCQRGKWFELVHELMLWDQAGQNQVRLCGAVLVNDELNVVFSSGKPKPDGATNANLSGVFSKVNFIDTTSFSNDCIAGSTFPGVIHFVAPATLF